MQRNVSTLGNGRRRLDSRFRLRVLAWCTHHDHPRELRQEEHHDSHLNKTIDADVAAVNQPAGAVDIEPLIPDHVPDRHFGNAPPYAIAGHQRGQLCRGQALAARLAQRGQDTFVLVLFHGRFPGSPD